MDQNVGKIMAAAAPVLDSTVVVLLGDHGWSLGEGNGSPRMQGCVWGGGTQLLLAQLAVPATEEQWHRYGHVAHS